MNIFLWAPATFFVGILLFLPLGQLFFLGLQNMTSSIFVDPLFVRIALFTYSQAFISSLLSLFLGGLAAFAIKEWKIPGASILWRFGLVCSSLPPLIVALGILGAWGPGTSLAKMFFEDGNIFGWTGILMGHVFLNFAIPLRWIGLALEERSLEGEYTALSLGMTRFQVFGKITWLDLRSSVFSSWALVFLYCSTSLFIVLFLGGSPRFTSLEVALYEAIKLNLESGKAVQIAGLQALMGGLIFFLYLRLRREKKQQGSQRVVTIYFPRGQFQRQVLGGAVWFVVLLLFGAPLGSILRDGIWGWSFLDAKDLLFTSLTSIKIALGVAALSLAISYPFMHWLRFKKTKKFEKFFAWVLVLPQFFSVLVVSLALSVFFPWLRSGEVWPCVGVVVSQSLFVIPLIQFPLWEGFQRLTDERFMIAQTLGANKVQRFFHVELPAMKKSIFLSVLIAFGFSFGEVVSVLLFAPTNIKTLSLGIFQAMSRYRFQEAHAYTVWLLIWILLVFGVAGWVEERKNG